LIYQVTGAPVNWDGRLNGQLQPTGTYVYILHFKDRKPDRKGTLNLIR